MWCACGHTWRNHPTQPATISTAPRMLIPTLVTRPAKANVRPRASTIGNAVGAGRCTTSSDMPLCPCWSSIASLFLSAANDVDNSKNHHPDPIDKVPVEREDLKLSRVLFLDLPRERE